MAQSVEHMLGKHEVPGPNPGSSSSSAYGNRVFPVAVFCFLQAVQEPRQRQRTGPCKNWRGSVKGWTIAAGRSVRRRGTVGLFTKRPGEKLQKPRGGENRQGVRYKCPACRILSMSAAEIDSLRRFPVFPEPFQEVGHNENCGRFSLPRPGAPPVPAPDAGGIQARRGGLSQTAGKKQRIGYSPGKGRAPCPFRHRVQRKRRAAIKERRCAVKERCPTQARGKNRRRAGCKKMAPASKVEKISRWRCRSANRPDRQNGSGARPPGYIRPDALHPAGMSPLP